MQENIWLDFYEYHLPTLLLIFVTLDAAAIEFPFDWFLVALYLREMGESLVFSMEPPGNCSIIVSALGPSLAVVFGFFHRTVERLKSHDVLLTTVHAPRAHFAGRRHTLAVNKLSSQYSGDVV